jgi:hypothetical protein
MPKGLPATRRGSLCQPNFANEGVARLTCRVSRESPTCHVLSACSSYECAVQSLSMGLGVCHDTDSGYEPKEARPVPRHRSNRLLQKYERVVYHVQSTNHETFPPCTRPEYCLMRSATSCLAKAHRPSRMHSSKFGFFLRLFISVQHQWHD